MKQASSEAIDANFASPVATSGMTFLFDMIVLLSPSQNAQAKKRRFRQLFSGGGKGVL
jgi:hypothetical protein